MRKCCGQGWAYNAQDKTCILLTNRSNPLLGKQVFNESVLSRTRLDLINGFPTSCEHKNFAILGTFKQDMFDEEHNVLRLENSARELKDTEFCLEHMFMRENDTVFSSFVTVFTCAEFFPSPGSQPEQNEIPRVSEGIEGGGSSGKYMTYNCPSVSLSSPGLPLRCLRGRIDHLVDLPNRHTRHQLPGALESPRAALEVSDVLRGLPVGRGLLPGHHSAGRGLDSGAVLLHRW